MIDVVVHGDAESVCDRIHGIEDGIAEELFPQVVPDVFGWVEFRGIRRQGQEHPVVRDLQSARTVARGAVMDHQDEVVRKRLSDMAREEGHAGAVHRREHEVSRSAVPRTERPMGMGVFPDDLFADDGPDACPGPASTGIVDPSEPGFVLKEDP